MVYGMPTHRAARANMQRQVSEGSERQLSTEFDELSMNTGGSLEKSVESSLESDHRQTQSIGPE